jgi:hypothetical protein
MKPGRTVEMTGAWKTRKTKPRFPFLSHGPWKSLRDSHIPTAPTIFVFQNIPNQIKKGDPGGGSLRSRLQAHSSMRKCLPWKHYGPERNESFPKADTLG